MAGNYDGCIRIDTRIDTNDFNKGTNTMNKGIKSVTKGLSLLSGKLMGSFNSNANIKALENDFRNATHEVEKQIEKVDELRKKLSALESGEIEIEDKSVKKLQSDFDKATASVKKTQAEINELYMQVENVHRNAFTGPTTQEPILTPKEQTQIQVTNAKLDELEAKLQKNQIKAEQLGLSLRNATGLATQNEIARTREKLAQSEATLSKLNIKAEKTGLKLKQASTPLTQISKGFEKLGKRITMLFSRVFIFSVISKALYAIVGIVKSIIMSNEEFRDSWYQLQAALWVAITPIIDIVIPALQTLVQWLTIAVNAVVRFAVALAGKNYSDIVKRAKALKKQSDAFEDLNKNSKKATKSLAAFDELNTLPKNDENEDVTGFTGATAENAFDSVSAFDTSSITQKMAELLKVIAGALIVIGVILLFTGHIGWGIGFIIAGATVFAISAQATSEKDPTQTPKKQIAEFLTYLGTAFLVIGVLLCFAQSWGLGIGCIIVGVASIVTAVALNWDGIKQKLQGTFGKVLGIISAGLLIIGLILVCTGNITPLSIGLIVAGAAGLAPVLALNWDKMTSAIENFIKENGLIVAGLSLAFLVLGIILISAGVSFPIGIALIAAGAVGIITAVALNWDKITTTISTFIQKNAGLVAGVSFGLLVLGIILVASGVGLPLGIALIAAGAVGLVTVGALKWDAIHNKIKETWNKIKDWWDTKVAKYFTASYWGQKGKDMINGLIKWVVSGINKLIDKLNSFGFKLPDVLGGGWAGFNISKLSIPQLAQGTVLPGGKPFLAIVNDQPRGQTNIEAPLDTIKQAVAEVNANMNVGSGFNGRIEVPIYLDSRQIALAVREAENNLGTQTVFGGFANAY